MSSDINFLVEKATSPLLLDIDWDTTIRIVDLIRQGDIKPKAAITSLLTRLEDSNPNIVLLALQVLESIVKNCGQIIHEYVATSDFMEGIYGLLQRNTNDEVQKKALMILAAWVYAFRNEPKYRAVQDTVNILKAEGYQIPSVIESDAMFTADRAPEWADGGCCHRCRSQFTMLRRKHHCRACGQVFCSDCSGKNSTIPKFGIEREVRVCDSCYDDINNPQLTPLSKPKVESSAPLSDVDSSKNSGNTKSADELREEEELQLALALSKSEAEDKEKEKLRATSNLLGGGWRREPSPPVSSPKKSTTVCFDKEEMDPELAKYLNRSYWEEQKQKHEKSPKVGIIRQSETDALRSFSPSAPSGGIKSPPKITEAYQNGETEEVDEFVSTLRSQLEIFVNRMKSNQSRGRPIANDTAVQSLFMNITAMHAQLLKYIQEQDNRRVHCEHLQDKISQIRDERAALEALREEHREKVRREKEEQERIRQIQMMQKLEIMRKKKQEYLDYQRQMALHRMAESERQILSVQQGGIPPPNTTLPPGYPPMAYPHYSQPHQVTGGYMYPPQGDGINVMSPYQGHAGGPQPPQQIQGGTQPIQGGPQQPPPPPGAVPPQQPHQGPITNQFPPGGPAIGAVPQGPAEFYHFNMQSLSQNLPSVPGYGSPSNGSVTSPPKSVEGSTIPLQGAPQPPMQQHPLPGMPPQQIMPPSQQPPMPPQPEEQTELISFD